MGIISLIIHSTVDFNLQIPANAMLFVAVIAIVYAAQHTNKDIDNRRSKATQNSLSSRERAMLLN